MSHCASTLVGPGCRKSGIYEGARSSEVSANLVAEAHLNVIFFYGVFFSHSLHMLRSHWLGQQQL